MAQPIADDALGPALESLLEEPVDQAQERALRALDDLTRPLADRIVLFGAGLLGRQALAALRDGGMEPLAFADNNAALWNRSIEGLGVLSPQEAAREFGADAAFLVAVFSPGPSYREIHRQLTALGCRNVVSCIPLLWKSAASRLPYFYVDLPHKVLQQKAEVRAGFEVWADAESQREYVAQVRLRLWADFQSLATPLPEEQYFPKGLFRLHGQECIVDCGAFCGDTLQDFYDRCGGRLGRYYAIEPDPGNYQKLRQRIDQFPAKMADRVTPLCYAVGAQEGRLRFSATGTGSAALAADGQHEVQCITLDSLLRDDRATYIKMDVEGAEFDALQGGRGAIGRDRPILAISAYHCPEDLWRLPLLIRSLSSDYRLFLRPHFEFTDLVCYAIPAHRCLCG